MIRDVLNYRETAPEKKKYEVFPSWMLISRDLVSIYDTRQDIALGKPPPLRHEVRYCEHFGEIDEDTGKLHDCQFHKVFHT